jgi:uncharacterized membrane protein YraQ (UPF0718 family)
MLSHARQSLSCRLQSALPTFPRQTVSKYPVSGNFWRSLAAVLIGNAIYFACSGFLPLAARHNTAGLDLGLVVDFWFCLVVMGLLELWYRRKKEMRGRR